LESECDEQLIIRIPFSNEVKISSMSINGNYNYSPSVVKLYKTHNVLSLEYKKAPTTSYNIIADRTEKSKIDAISIEDAHCHLDLSF
jgi:hypothetical protein